MRADNTTELHIRLPLEMREQLERIAATELDTVSALARRILAAWLRKQSGK